MLIFVPCCGAGTLHTLRSLSPIATPHNKEPRRQNRLSLPSTNHISTRQRTASNRKRVFFLCVVVMMQVRFALARRGPRHGILGHDTRPRAALLGESHLPRHQGRQESPGGSHYSNNTRLFIGSRLAWLLWTFFLVGAGWLGIRLFETHCHWKPCGAGQVSFWTGFHGEACRMRVMWVVVCVLF